MSGAGGGFEVRSAAGIDHNENVEADDQCAPKMTDGLGVSCQMSKETSVPLMSWV